MGQVVTSGVWRSVSVDVDEMKLSGLDTERIMWGVPAEGDPNAGQSSYEFEGCAANAKLDGTDFVLGTFKHHNWTIVGMRDPHFWATLAVNVYFEDNEIEHDFSARFRHFETPNDSEQPDDVVDLPEVSENDVVYIDGIEYRVSITGFWRRNRKVHKFYSPEGGSNSADIMAKFERTGPPPGS